MSPRLMAVVAAFALGGCASNYCSREQPYQTAQSIPPIVGTGDLKVTTPPTALRVPDAKGEPGLTYGYQVPDPKKPGKKKTECLDAPPPMPPVAEAPKAPEVPK